MTRSGLDIIDNLDVTQIADASPKDISILTEQTAATLPKDKYQFFDFNTAEQYYRPADIAKAIEIKAKKKELNIPFNFEKFKLDTKGDYNLMYQALKKLPDYMYNKDKQKIGSIVKTRIRDKAKEALDSGQITRKTFDTIYRKAHFAVSTPKAVNPNTTALAIGETVTGAMQTVAGLVKTGTDIANELGADIDTTSLDALITHYDKDIREYQHALGEQGNAIFTFQNLGDLVLGFGLLGKLFKSTKYTAGVGERFRDYAINGAIGGGLGYVVAKGRNEENPETAAAFGILGGVALSSAVHNLSKLGMSNYTKLDQTLRETLNLSDEDVNKAVQEYAKYMKVDNFEDLYSPKTSVEAMLLIHGSDIASLITKTGGDTTKSMQALANFVNQRKEKLFDFLNRNDLDIDHLGAKISEANVLAQHLWDKVTYNIGQQLVDLPEDVVKKSKIANTPLDSLDELTRTKVARIKEIIKEPSIEGLMEADKVINEIKRGLKNNKARYREWSEFQTNLQNTLKEVMPEQAYKDWIELKGLYAQVAKARDSKVGKILTADMTPEAKIQKLSRIGIERGDFKAIANLAGEQEVAKLEKAIIKEALTENPNKRSWQALDKAIKKQSFVTEEGKKLARFVSDMNKHFKLDDEIARISHNLERNVGFREDLWGAVKANIIGRIGMKLANTVLDIFKTKDVRLDSILYDYLDTVYANANKVKDFNIKIQNLDEPLIDRLRREAVEETMQDMQGEFTKGKYYNATHDILIENNKVKGIDDTDLPQNGGAKPIKPLPTQPNGGGEALDINKYTKEINQDFDIKVYDRLNNIFDLNKKYNYTYPQLLNLVTKSLSDLIEDTALLNKVAKEYTLRLQNAGKVATPIKLDDTLYYELLKNPSRELEEFNSKGIYIDLYGLPKQLKEYQTIDELTKAINDDPKITLKVDSSLKKGEGALEYNNKLDIYELKVADKTDFKSIIHEYTHYLQNTLDRDEFDEALNYYGIGGTVTKNTKVEKDKYFNLIGEVEARVSEQGSIGHPIVDMLNKYGLNLTDTFYRNDKFIKEKIFDNKMRKIYPILDKIESKNVSIEDLPEIRRYIALRYRNPSYVTNPYVAKTYGLQVDLTKVDPNKLKKYKEVFDEAKHFKIIPTTLAMSGAAIASDITLDSFIKGNEGVRYKPYKDTRGYWTIGYGHKLRTGELAKYKKGISQIEAEELFRKDLGWVKSRIKKLVPNYDSLDKRARLVLLDLGFNLGITGLAKFKNMRKALANKDYIKAAEELLNSTYAEQLPNRAYKNASMLYEIGIGYNGGI